MNKTKIFIDFDGTLFDSRRFKRDVHQIPVDLGLDREVVEKAYEEWKKTHHADPIAMLRWLATTNRFDRVEEAIKRTQEIIDNSGDYLFDDALDFLKRIDRTRFSPILFTLGYESFQNEKILRCQIEHFFDEVIYTEIEKIQSLAELASGEGFFVIDDTVKFLQAVRAEFAGSGNVIGIDRYGENDHNGESNYFQPNLAGIDLFNAREGALEVV